MKASWRCVFAAVCVLAGPWIRKVAAAAAEQDSTEALRRAVALREKGDYAGAAEAFEEGLARAPRSSEVWVRWVDFALERFRILELGLRTTQKGMAVVLRLQAEGLRIKGRETREELLSQSATADPQQPGIWGELGVEQLRSRMRGKAAASLKTAQELQPQASSTLELEAMTAAIQADWAGAEKRLLELGGRSPREFGRAGRDWPKNLAPQKGTARGIWRCVGTGSSDCPIKIAFPEGQAAKTEEQLFAQESWERLAALPAPAGGSGRAWFEWGVALAELNDCRGAVPALERGLESGAETAAFWMERCYASEAERAIESVSLLKSDIAAHLLRGDFLVRVKGDPKSAASEYAKAIQLSPKDAGLKERLAQAYMSMGEVQKAKEAGLEALALSSRRPMTLRLLVSVAINERDYTIALEYLKQMLAMAPNDTWARVQAGIAYAQTGHAEQAFSNLQPALAAGYPDDRGALHATLASVLRKLGREEEAQSAAAEASRLSDLFQRHAQKSLDDPQ